MKMMKKLTRQEKLIVMMQILVRRKWIWKLSRKYILMKTMMILNLM